MLSKEEVLREGAKKLLEENEKEREFLLKLLGNHNQTDQVVNDIKQLVKENVGKVSVAHPWTKEQHRKFRATMAAKRRAYDRHQNKTRGIPQD